MARCEGRGVADVGALPEFQRVQELELLIASTPARTPRGLLEQARLLVHHGRETSLPTPEAAAAAESLLAGLERLAG